MPLTRCPRCPQQLRQFWCCSPSEASRRQSTAMCEPQGSAFVARATAARGACCDSCSGTRATQAGLASSARELGRTRRAHLNCACCVECTNLNGWAGGRAGGWAGGWVLGRPHEPACDSSRSARRGQAAASKAYPPHVSIASDNGSQVFVELDKIAGRSRHAVCILAPATRGAPTGKPVVGPCAGLRRLAGQSSLSGCLVPDTAGVVPHLSRAQMRFSPAHRSTILLDGAPASGEAGQTSMGSWGQQGVAQQAQQNVEVAGCKPCRSKHT